MSYKLEKPYTEVQRADFIVEYNHKEGLRIEETETVLYALEEYEILENDEVVDVSNTTEYISEQFTKVKADKLTEVNDKAYGYENNGLISYDGINSNGENVTIQIETSDKNIGKINGLINMFNAEKITQYIWSAKDDTQFVIKKDDAYNLSGLFAEFSSKIWLVKQPHFKNLVEKTTTIEDLNAIVVDYSVDIPTE